jgi:transcription elongation factor SPT5
MSTSALLDARFDDGSESEDDNFNPAPADLSDEEVGSGEEGNVDGRAARVENLSDGNEESEEANGNGANDTDNELGNQKSNVSAVKEHTSDAGNDEENDAKSAGSQQDEGAADEVDGDEEEGEEEDDDEEDEEDTEISVCRPSPIEVLADAI